MTPKYHHSDPSNAACLKGDAANPIKFYTEGEAHVLLDEIDGERVQRPEVCVSPGRHTVTIRGANMLRVARGPLDLEFQPNRKYWMRGNYRDGSIVFRLFDVTDGAETELAQFKMAVNDGQNLIITPGGVPVVVPK